MLWAANATIDESTPWHTHGIFELILCRSSGGKLQLEDREIAFLGERTILITPNVRHCYVLRGGEATDLKVVCLTPPDMAVFLSPATIAGLRAAKTAGVTYLDASGASFSTLDISALIPDGYGLQSSGELRLAWSAIGLLLARICQSIDEPLDGTSQRRRARFQEVRAWIDSHLDSEIDLDTLASIFGVSRSLLSREFRRYSGQSVVEYFNFRRVERSAQRLADGLGTVAEIARASGFRNLSHFHHQFKAVYGLTPAAFRRIATSTESG